MERTSKTQLMAYLEQMNHALERKNARVRVGLRNAYGMWGLSESKNGLEARDITGLMSKKELAAYMRAAIAGIRLFE